MWYNGNFSHERDFRGKGPKGYKRSDERINEDIHDVLSSNEWLDASDIEVKVEESEVTLIGTVNSKRDKRLAEDLADGVFGVSNVENRLRVKLFSEETDDKNDSNKSTRRHSNHVLN
jgi:osmotically-inducible protein OsmY